MAPDRASVDMERTGALAVIRIDDGKVNALSNEVIDGINDALTQVEADDDVGAVALLGRPGRFSAGFDLTTMTESAAAAWSLVDAGARMVMRLYGFSRPVVAGCTGHAIAGGAIMLMASDLRIGADIDARIGLNEISIGMPVPTFAVELARARLSRRHYPRATMLSTIYSPAQAVDVGFLDVIVDPEELESAVISRAADLAERLDRSAFAATRVTDRGTTIDFILASLDADRDRLDPDG